MRATTISIMPGSLFTPTVATGTSWSQHFVIKDIREEGQAALDMGLLRKLDSLRDHPESVYSSFEEFLTHLNNLKRL